MTKCLNCGHSSDEGFQFCPKCGTKAAEAEPESLVGKTLSDKYRVQEEIGAGAMGTVYRAEHVSLRKTIALKVLHRDLYVSEESLKRFQGEGIAAGKFNHPNAIQIFDFDKDEGQLLYLAMEFVEGSNITQYLAENGPLPPLEAVQVTLQILSALAEAHRHGIVHRDLKPDNVMLVKSATGELDVKVLDFGLSKLVDLPAGASMQTQAGRLLGTPRYMAPEQWSGVDVDHRLDLWAAGLVLYELLTGVAPFAGDTIHETLMKSTKEPVPPLAPTKADLEKFTGYEGLNEVIGKALEKDREDRFQSAEEMAAALTELCVDGWEPVRIAAPRRKREVAEPAGKRNLLVPIAAVLVVAMGIAVWQIFLQGGSNSAQARVRLKPAGERSALEILYLERLEEARAQIATGKTDDARATLERARLMECADAEGFLVRSLLYRARNDDAAALADLEEALRMDPRYVDAANQIGWILLDREDHDAALQRFEKALEWDEQSGEAHAGKGSVLLARGDAANAEPLLRKAIELDRGSAIAHLRLGEALLARDNAEEAIAAFIDAKRNDARLGAAYAGLGEAYLRTGKTEEAERELREAIRIAPAVGPQVALGTLLVHAERYADGRAVVEDALGSAPKNPRLLILKGLIAYGRRKYTEAQEAFEGALAAGAKDAGASALLGYLYLRAGKNDKAAEQCEKAVAIDDKVAMGWSTLGIARFRLDRFEDAATALRKATELDDTDAFAFYSLGVILMDYLDDEEGALACFEKCEALGSDNPNVERFLQRLRK